MPHRPEHEPLYKAARDFADRCLAGNQSLLWPDRTAWTAANVAEVKRRHVDTPLEAEGSFDEILMQQMAGASAEQWAVICDTYYVYYLPAANIKPSTKRQKIEQLLVHAGLPAPAADVWAAQSPGFTRIGQRYNLKRHQFRLLLMLAGRLKQTGEAREIVSNAARLQEALDALLDSIPEPAYRARDMRHALLYLLFPNNYEPIIDTSAKTRILETFGVRVGPTLPADLDQALRAIRAALAPQYDSSGQLFRFYDEPLKQQWQAGRAWVAGRPPTDRQAPGQTQLPPADTAEPSDVARVLIPLTYTRNVILYGPPGTGKTYIAGEVAQALVRSQLLQAPPETARLQAIAAELPFYELVALALYQAGAQRTYPVAEIMQMPLVQARLQVSPVAHPRESVWNNLQSHTAPDSATVRVTRRAEPFLFDKDTESRWHLTAEGRTYVDKELGEALATLQQGGAAPTTSAEYIVWTTFHQSYAYEDFVEGIRPQANENGELTYPVVPGVLREISRRAGAQPNQKFVLVIDEINRGNIAKIFGELITLLEDDKRGRLSMRLPYSGQSFTVPPNLYVIGTMNTADRSIALLDVALRRRFAFVELTPEPDLLTGAVVSGPDTVVELAALLRGLNAGIRQHLGHDYEIGHSYLLRVSAAAPEARLPLLEFVWNNQIIPLLHEYFYSQPEKLQQVLEPFVLADSDEPQPALSANPDLGRAEGDELIAALARLAAG